MTDEPPRREYSSARSRQFQMHLHNVYFKAYAYPGVRIRLPVQDWERENSWAINAAGMSLIILARWKEGKEEGSLRHRDFSSTPIPWTTTSFISVSSAVLPLVFFLPSLFFIHFLLVFYLMIVFQICRNVFNSMTAQGLWSIVVSPISRVRFYGIAVPITIARGKLLYKIWDSPCFLRFVSVLEIL